MKNATRNDYFVCLLFVRLAEHDLIVFILRVNATFVPNFLPGTTFLLHRFNEIIRETDS